MDTFSFENLNAYKEAKSLVVEVYKLIAKFPQSERFALSAQLQRAIVSVPSNIAEGSGRVSYKEKIHFLEIAYGSLMESFCQLEIACELNYISAEELAKIKEKLLAVSRLINGLSQSFQRKLNSLPYNPITLYPVKFTQIQNHSRL